MKKRIINNKKMKKKKVFVYVIGASSSGPVTSKERSVFEKFGQYIRARYLVDSDDFTLARVTRPMCPRLVSSTNVRLLPALLIYDHGALVSVTEGVSMSNGSVKLADMAMSSHNKAEAARLGIAQQPASTDAAAQVETEERAGRLLGVLLSSNVRHLAVKYDPKLKRLNLVKVVLAVLGLALSIIQAEVSFNFPALRDGALVNALRVITSALTAALLLMIVRGYILLLKIDQYRWNLSRRRSLFSSSLLFKCLAELVLCAVHPFPTFGAQLGDRPYFPDGTTFGSFVVNEMVPTLMFTRIFLLFPLIRDYSPVWTSRKEIISGAVGSGGGAVSDGSPAFSAEFGWFLALKTLFFFKPVIFILVCISVAPICFSYVILVAERRYQPALLSKFSSSLWYTAITMLTVGYGDITAVSIWGRSYAVIAGFAGIVITALVITVVSDSLNMSNGERFAATTAKLKAVTEQEMNVAAYFIQFCFKEMMSYRKLRLSNAGRDEVRRHEMTILTKKVALVKSLKSIRKERKELLESTLYAEPLITRLELLQTNITSLSNSVMALVARSVRQQQLLSRAPSSAAPCQTRTSAPRPPLWREASAPRSTPRGRGPC
jgi:hypothetical protein